MVRRIVAKEKHDCTHLLGTYVDESHYDILVEELSLLDPNNELLYASAVRFGATRNVRW